jgi:hypothetical protein
MSGSYFQTVDVVIDQTYASDPTEYKLSTFLENINVGRDSCFSFVTNQSIWRFDRRIGDSKTLVMTVTFRVSIYTKIISRFSQCDMVLCSKWSNFFFLFL